MTTSRSFQRRLGGPRAEFSARRAAGREELRRYDAVRKGMRPWFLGRAKSEARRANEE